MPILNRKCCFEFLVWKFVFFYESDHAFKTIWWLACSCRLIKIKGHFFKLVLWLNANFKTGFRKRKFGEKPGIFDLSNAKK